MIPINSPFSGMGPLLLFLAKATVLLVAASVAMIPLRRGTAGARHLVWQAALVGVLLSNVWDSTDAARALLARYHEAGSLPDLGVLRGAISAS